MCPPTVKSHLFQFLPIIAKKLFYLTDVLQVHKYHDVPVQDLNVLCTFNLRPVSTWYIICGKGNRSVGNLGYTNICFTKNSALNRLFFILRLLSKVLWKNQNFLRQIFQVLLKLYYLKIYLIILIILIKIWRHLERNSRKGQMGIRH